MRPHAHALNASIDREISVTHQWFRTCRSATGFVIDTLIKTTINLRGAMRRYVCSSLMMAGIVGLVMLVRPAEVAAAGIVFSASGSDPASIQATVDAYRLVLGDNNGTAGVPQTDGRREINWDGGGAAALATIFPNPQTTFSARGNVNTSPGGAVEQSGQPMPEFGEINPTYPDIFQTFS